MGPDESGMGWLREMLITRSTLRIEASETIFATYSRRPAILDFQEGKQMYKLCP